MYIMVKVEKILGLFVVGNVCLLSILASRAHNLAVVELYSKRLNPISTSQRINQFRKTDQRGLRKSSSLTNGIGSGRNKTALKEYGTEARGLACPATSSMRPSWTLR